MKLTALFTASYRAFQPDMGQPVVASLGLPKWRPEAATWPRCHLLTPTWPMLGLHDPDVFRVMFEQRLARFGVRKIAAILERIAREHQAAALVILCHEADWERCHRGQFAGWWLQATGELVCDLT